MNMLFYLLTEYCKELSMKNFRERGWFSEWSVYRSDRNKQLTNRAWVEKINERLEIKIKELIKLKKRAEKLLDIYKR